MGDFLVTMLFVKNVEHQGSLSLKEVCPQDITILGWCPAGPVLPHGEKVPLLPWLVM